MRRKNGGRSRAFEAGWIGFIVLVIGVQPSLRDDASETMRLAPPSLAELNTFLRSIGRAPMERLPWTARKAPVRKRADEDQSR